MKWKKIKIGLLILLGLLILIPTIMYVGALDWGRKHQTKVEALPIFTPEVEKGTFRLAANEMEFLIRVAGMQQDGDPIILLHGFPESSMMWESLLDTAAAHGYKVLAFDQRGYSPGARPSGVAAYHIDLLVEDVLKVADAVGFERFHLVGHDWGSAVGWKTTMDFPERVNSWTAMAIPHIGVFFDAVLNHPEQQKRSSYMNLLRMPILPEFRFQTKLDEFYERVEGLWTPAQIQACKSIQREPGAITSMLNWYRAVEMEEVVANNQFNKTISCPTLFLWGKKDGVIAPEIMPEQAPLIGGPFQTISLDAGHSLMQEKPDSVMQLMLIHWERNQQSPILPTKEYDAS